MDNELNKIERRILTESLRYCDSVRAGILEMQIRSMKVTHREKTGVGFMTYVQVDPQCASLEEKKTIVLYAAGEIEGVAVEYLSFVRDGKIEWIEGYAYGGQSYPYEMEDRIRFLSME